MSSPSPRPAVPEPHPPFPKQHQVAPGAESKLEPAPRYRAPEYKAAGKLSDKIALITGGDSGIGRAVAVLFAREGASLALNYLEEEQADTLVYARAEMAQIGDRARIDPTARERIQTLRIIEDRTKRNLMDLLRLRDPWPSRPSEP